MKKLILFILSFVLVLFVGCTSTRINSIRNYEANVKVSKILVVSDFQDPKFEKYLEDRYSLVFEKYKISTIGESKIFNPFKNYTTEEIEQKLHDNKIDAIWIVNVGGSERETAFVDRNTGIASSVMHTSFTIELKAFPSGEIVWRASAYSTTELDVYAIIRSLAKESVADYMKTK